MITPFVCFLQQRNHGCVSWNKTKRTRDVIKNVGVFSSFHIPVFFSIFCFQCGGGNRLRFVWGNSDFFEYRKFMPSATIVLAHFRNFNNCNNGNMENVGKIWRKYKSFRTGPERAFYPFNHSWYSVIHIISRRGTYKPYIMKPGANESFHTD